MTQEITQDFVGFDNPEFAEHDSFSRSKKVIAGPTVFASHTDGSRTISPIQAAIGTELALVKGKTYRVIASAPVYFRQAAETGSVAIVGDIYLPADTAIIINTKDYPFLASVAVAGAGIIQAVEVK